jgi:tetratricopeptide (TPR) repeat protein
MLRGILANETSVTGGTWRASALSLKLEATFMSRSAAIVDSEEKSEDGSAASSVFGIAAARVIVAIGMLGLATAGCVHRGAGPVGPTSAAPVTSYEMEPIKITAVAGPDGTHVEAYDAAELFEQAGKALSDKRYDDAIRAYDRVLKEFQDSRYTGAALYNAGLAYQGKKDWDGALARFKTLCEGYGDSSDAKDGLFQLGATYAELNNWPMSARVLAQALDRKDLTSDDRLEALARRGFAQFQLKDLDTAERTFRSAVTFFHQIETEERLETDFYLALAMYHLGQVSHERFRAVALRLPEKQMGIDLEAKAHLLLASQRQYIDTIKLGNPGWASASGFQIGSLYEELYDAFIHAPVPAELLRPDAHEKLDVYYGEVRKKIRILLEKSVRTHESNLLMMERLGVHNEWRDKSKLAYAKIQELLDPSYRPAFQPSDSAISTAAPAVAPPIPQAPAGRGGSAEVPVDGAVPVPAETNRPSKVKPTEGPVRQIM